MKDAFKRTELLIGADNLLKLKNSSVALFGAGGVGGFAAEALARSGIGEITVFDNDVIAESNLNRQIIATADNIGEDKTEALKKRLESINPDITVNVNKVFYLPENADAFDLSIYDYVIDAVDTVAAKLEIITRATAAGVPVITCMGTGGKTDPAGLKVEVIEKTKGCPLARVVRRELVKRGIKGVKAVYSEETHIMQGCAENAEKRATGRVCPPSMIFVPGTAGLMLAREVVFDLIKNNQ